MRTGQDLARAGGGQHVLLPHLLGRGRRGRGLALREARREHLRRGEDEAEEGRARVLGPALELRVELRREVERVRAARQLDDLHARVRVVLADEAEARLFELGHDVGVHLVAVPVALRDRGRAAVDQRRDRRLAPLRPGVLVEDRVAGPQPHGPAQLALLAEGLGHEDDGRLLALFVELRRVRAGPAQLVAGVLDDGDLHAQADAEVGLLLLATELGARDHALDAPYPEAAGHDDAVGVLDLLPGLFAALGARLELLRVHVFEV